MPFTTEDVLAGQAVYSRRLLIWYDLFVLRLSCHSIWTCPASRMLAHYDEHISANHLEVGVGTGYFLDRCRFPPVENAAGFPQVSLFDLNAHCLERTGRRIARYRPKAFAGSVLEPLDVGGQTFDSAGLNFVVHCLPGALREKGIAFDHLHSVLNPGGVLFGATLLACGVPRGWLARRLMAYYNARKVFSNSDDSLDDLRTELGQRFDDVHVETCGCAALFVARRH